MKFDPLVQYTEMARDSVTIVLKGSDGRFYVSSVDEPDRWTSSHHALSGAMESLSFTKEFWQSKMKPELRDSPRTARVDGVHYYIGDSNANTRAFRGFGGALFLVEFNDGRRVQTTNMWCQGTIPKALRTELPDNARFHATPYAMTGEQIDQWLAEGSIPHLNAERDENNLPPAR